MGEWEINREGIQSCLKISKRSFNCFVYPNIAKLSISFECEGALVLARIYALRHVLDGRELVRSSVADRFINYTEIDEILYYVVHAE